MNYPDRPSQLFRVETLAPALITLLVLAALQPLVVITVTVMPFLPDDAMWRVRVYALILGTTPQFAVCLVVIAAVGLFAERYSAVRGAAFASLVLGAVLIPILIFDALDIIQVQQMIPLDQLRHYRFTALQTSVMAALMVPVLFWVGRRGLLAGKGEPRIDITDALMIDQVPAPGPLDPRVTN